MRWPHAVLFDFDGVIVNSEPLHFLAFHQVLAAEKIELSEEEYYREMIGFDDKGAFRHIFASRGRELDRGVARRAGDPGTHRSARRPAEARLVWNSADAGERCRAQIE